jgi:hypothetical protein
MAASPKFVTTATLVICSAFAGAWISNTLRSRDAQSATTRPLDHTPERVIPEQSLNIAGAGGKPIGSLDAGGGGTVLHLWPSFAVTAYSDGATTLTLYAREEQQGHGEMMIKLAGQELICIDCPDHLLWAIFRPLPAKSLRQYVHDWFYLPKPTPEKPDDVVPNADVRLVDKRGWRFATLGLTSSGDPAIALTDIAGNVQVAWVQRRQFPEDWWELAVFDSSGLRISLELHPGAGESACLRARPAAVFT